MAIQWTKDLRTGCGPIDDQHREIFGRIDAMFDACSKGKGRQEVKGLLAFLEDYVVSHFGAEEQYMKRLGYAGYDAHKRQHLEIAGNLAELRKKVAEEGVGVHTVVAVNRLVVQQFANHIRTADVRLGSVPGGRTMEAAARPALIGK